MFHNYFRLALRNLLKHKGPGFINITGLSIGTAIVMLLSLYVWDEWTFDRFHSKADRIYRVWVKEHFKGDVFFNTVTPVVLGQELRDNFPEIQQVVRYYTINTLAKKGNFSELEEVHFAEPSFFKVFDFKLSRGKVENVLSDMHSAVITEETGLKYFGDPYPLGQTLTLQTGGEWTHFTVTGIAEKAPGNSSIRYDIIVPFEKGASQMPPGARTSWTNVVVETYILLNEANKVRGLEAKFAPFVDGKVASGYKPGEYVVGFQPLTDIHLNKDFPLGLVPVSDRRYSYILAGIALLILGLACINFTTLAVGRSVMRAREVGVRKATGATREQLMAQFWNEAVLTAGVSVLVGLLLASAALPFFNDLADKQLTLDFSPQTLLLLTGLALATGLVSGVYPALVLSGFKPALTLRGVVSKAGGNRYAVLRGLVGFQFMLSVLLIISTLVMLRQMQFLQNKNLGYDKEQVVVLPYKRSGARLTDQWAEGKKILELLRNELDGKPGFSDWALSAHTFGTPGWTSAGYTEPATQKFRRFMLNGVDDRFLPMHSVALASGRHFSRDNISDSKAVIVNEAYARQFGVESGQKMPEPFREFEVIGVAKDFNFESLHSAVLPLVMAYDPIGIIRTASDWNFEDTPNPKLSVKIAGSDIPATLSTLRLAWQKVAPGQAFNYAFLDHNIDKQYRAESRLSQLVGIATGLAILIACLGLFGIATLIIALRTKEIGVRKVLGASVTGITGLLTKDFLKLVGIAILIASPPAYFFMNKWLSDFAYRIDIQWWIFAVAGAVAGAVAFLTVGFQSVKAALANPVKSLRNE
ncbi:MAG: macrolide ABC transporter permease [Haliscomenobacteraceae bacterium CHB4]|nr:macrolide ABC transporter permease [Haliscomenobacteraceae bacterium CHB4]